MSARRIVAWMALVVSCGGTSRQTATPARTGGLESACNSMANTYCSRLAECAPAALMQFLFASTADCVTSSRADCIRDGNAPLSAWNPQAIRACDDAVHHEQCDSLITGITPPVCHAHGGVPEGGGCTQSDQCVTARCRIDPGARCGTCATMPHAGDPCGVDGCHSEELRCTDARVCAAVGAQGASCDPALAPCAYGLACRGFGATRTCQPNGRTDGAPCTAASADVMGACDIRLGLLCNMTEGRCRPMQVALTGEPCGLLPTGIVGCAQRASCTGVTAEHPAGTCAPTPTLGSACEPVMEPACPTGSSCIVGDGGTRGVCEILDANACR